MSFLPMNDDEKWSIFQNIDAQCWTQVAPAEPGFAIWELRGDWLAALFNGAYKALRANADLALTNFRAIVFVTEDGAYEARIVSQQRQGGVYDFRWLFAPTGQPDTSTLPAGSLEQRVTRLTMGGDVPPASANAIWLIDPAQITQPVPSAAKNFRIFCAEIDETIDFNIDALELRRRETAQEAGMRLLPWQQTLLWMARLEAIDHAAFQKLPSALRTWLHNANIKMQPGAVTERDVALMQQDGSLPKQLASLKPEDIPALRESIKLQQSLVSRPDFLTQFNQISPIPKLLTHVDAGNLDPIDLQVFMTLGALREVHGFLETEMERLLQRRPDLQAIAQSPQGTRQLEADAEYLALKTHPQAIAEQQDLQDIMLRRTGNYGPTMREVMEAEKQKLEVMQAQTMGMLNPMLGLAAAWQSNKAHAAANTAPAWKVYKPYLC